MFIKQEEYRRLCNCEKLKDELEKEVRRLAAMISATTKDCTIGVWCKDCAHLGVDKAIVQDDTPYGLSYVSQIGGSVLYCKKHIHDMCKEFNRR